MKSFGRLFSGPWPVSCHRPVSQQLIGVHWHKQIQVASATASTFGRLLDAVVFIFPCAANAAIADCPAIPLRTMLMAFKILFRLQVRLLTSGGGWGESLVQQGKALGAGSM